MEHETEVANSGNAALGPSDRASRGFYAGLGF
jgi:hypothetical protein